MTLYEFDAQFASCGPLCGVDEAGRGPLAGPVFAAAVMLPSGVEIDGLNDSKKLTEKKREQVYGQIKLLAVSYCVAVAGVEEIEKLNILGASLLAMKRAVEGLSARPAYALVDGNILPILDVKCEAVVKGDAKSAAVAAASILAKVERDAYMCKLDAAYPGYGFARHKGYPTKSHYAALDALGPAPVHRTSFLKKWVARNER